MASKTMPIITRVKHPAALRRISYYAHMDSFWSTAGKEDSPTSSYDSGASDDFPGSSSGVFSLYP